jgi:hypothetical protein
MAGSVFTDPGSQMRFPSLPLDIAEEGRGKILLPAVWPFK